MQDFVFFLGRFHVFALHLPIGIILAAVALDWTARRATYRQLAVLSPFLWALAAASAVLTVVLGYMHFAEGAFSGAIGERASVLRNVGGGDLRRHLVALADARSYIEGSTSSPESSRSRRSR